MTALAIRERLASPQQLAEIAKVVPRHMTAERMARTALTATLRNPDLLECDEQSFFKCLMDLSAWGLEPDGRRAHLIPFRNNKRGCIECTLILDYKGLAELAYRSGYVLAIHADVIREGDIFDYTAGTISTHIPYWLRRDSNRPAAQGDILGAYCIVHLAEGALKADVMSRDEIESVRKRSRSASSGPWVTDWTEMAKKTVFRRASKWLPLSAEFRDACALEDEAITESAPPKSVSIADVVGMLDVKPKQNDANVSG